jgi:peptidoglycan DL-endopeptidase CwlO
VSHGRKRFFALVSGLMATVAVSLSPMSPTYAEPDLADVKKRVQDLYHQAEAASERRNDIRLELTELKRGLAALKADERRQTRRLNQVRTQVEDTVVRQYEGETLSTVGQVVVSEDPGSFLAGLTTASAFSEIQAGAFADYARELKALDLRATATRARVTQVAAAEKRASAESVAIDKNLTEAKSLLGRLEARERSQITNPVTTGGAQGASPAEAANLPDVPASGRAAAAVSYAKAQVGKSYVFGAAGPSAFDCSGLTMMAWAQAGVGLPHSSSAQFGSGARIASSALQPGDLVFYYSPISHVGLYVGGGQIVHAANPSSGVQVAGVFSMPYTGAVRPG